MNRPDVVVEFAPGYGPYDDFDNGWRTLRFYTAHIDVGRQADDQEFPAGTATLELPNDGRELDPDFIHSPWYATKLHLTGGFSAAGARTPDRAALDIVGDIELLADLAPVDVTPASGPCTIAGKWLTTGNQRSWALLLNAGGTIGFSWAPAGTFASILTTNSTGGTGAPWAAAGLGDGDRLRIKIGFDVDNGAGQRVTTFSWSTDFTRRLADVTDWTVFSTVTTAGATSIFASSAQVQIGGGTEISSPLDGDFHEVIIRSGIGGTPVASPDFTIALGDGATGPVTDGQGAVWTIASSSFGTTVVADTVKKSWLRPHTPFRIRATDGIVDEVLYLGFTDTGFAQQYRPPAAASCTVGLVDWFGVIAGNRLADVFQVVAMAKGPRSFWPLDDTVPGAMRDIAGGFDGSISDDVVRTTATTATGITYAGVDLDGIIFGTVVDPASFPNLDAGFTAVAAVQPAAGAGSVPLLSFGHGVLVAGTRDFFHIRASHQLVSSECESGGSALLTVSSGTHEIADSAHLVGASVSVASAQPKVYIDGVDVSGSPSSTGASVELTGCQVGKAKAISNQWDGWVGNVVIFSRELTAGEMAELADAFLQALDGQTTSGRAGWVLDQLGIVPAAYQSIDGDVVLGPALTDGEDALGYLQKVSTTEGGGLYVDRGVLTMRPRYGLWEGRSATVQWTFSDDDTDPDAIHVEPDKLTLSPNGTAGMANTQEVAWVGGVEYVQNAASVDEFGPIPGQRLETIAASAGDARTIGEWNTSRRGFPRTRVTGLGFNPAATGKWEAAVGVRIGDLCAYHHTPQNIPPAIDRQAHVEGVTHDIGPGLEWTVDLHVTESSGLSLFLWDDSLLDGPDVLA